MITVTFFYLITTRIPPPSLNITFCYSGFVLDSKGVARVANGMEIIAKSKVVLLFFF